MKFARLAQLSSLLLAGGLAGAQPQPAGPQGRPPQQLRVPPNVEVIRDVEFGTGGGRPLHLDIARPKEPPAEPMPVLVYIHGGAWRAGNHHGGQNIQFAGQGYFTVNVEYRLSQEAIFPAQIEDCKAAIRWLRANAEKYNLDTDHIGVWGHSAGGHLAALVGTSGDAPELEGEGGNPGLSTKVHAVVDGFGPTDFVHEVGAPSGIDRTKPNSPEALLLGGLIMDRPEQVKLASPLTYIDPADPPFLILHGEQDNVVPINQSEYLTEALQTAGVDVTFVRVKNGGHGFRGDTDPTPAAINQMIAEFFHRHLRGR
jgi:acetyl esterase/lipase